jgi:hypothetical protein
MTARCASNCSGLSSPGCSRSLARRVDDPGRAVARIRCRPGLGAVLALSGDGAARHAISAQPSAGRILARYADTCMDCTPSVRQANRVIVLRPDLALARPAAVRLRTRPGLCSRVPRTLARFRHGSSSEAMSPFYPCLNFGVHSRFLPEKQGFSEMGRQSGVSE